MTRRTKGDGGLYQRKDGLWVGVVELPMVDGERRRKRVASKDRNTALARLKKLRADVDAGRIAVTGNTTVAQWLDRWLTEIHGTELRPTTFRDYESVIRLHINPHIGSKRLDKLTPAHVRQMQRDIEAPRTAQKAHVILRRALQDAMPEGMLTVNVAELVHKPRHTAEEREPLTSAQAKHLMKSVIDNGDPWATRWCAALFLGARQGEILGLQWSRLKLDAGVVDLRWQLQALSQAHGCGERHSDRTWPCGRKKVGWCPNRRWDLPRGFEHKVLHRSLLLTRPKTKAGTRVVDIPLPLWEMLKLHPYGDKNPHDLVWHHPDGRPLHPRDDYSNWQNALKQAGLPPAPLHVARHTTNTLLLEAGVSREVRKAILGHVSESAQDAYSHIGPSVTRDAMDRTFGDY